MGLSYTVPFDPDWIAALCDGGGGLEGKVIIWCYLAISGNLVG
jgi:hypothetical protein